MQHFQPKSQLATLLTAIGGSLLIALGLLLLGQGIRIAALRSVSMDFSHEISHEPLPAPVAATARPITVVSRQVAGVPIYFTTINLTDPQTFISIGLANRATLANSARGTKGDESFIGLVRHHQAAMTASGTFFSMDVQKRVMGNMVAGGRWLKYSPWENYGTTLGLRAGNRPEMVTARTEGKPQWEQHWFSLTAGPRLLKQGQVKIAPKREGFTDPAVMGSAVRSAIGFPRHGRQLFMVTFRQPVSLKKSAQIMQYLGCYEAMNLDGGTSLALAKGNRILYPAGRELTNVITVYDVNHPAPAQLVESWEAFQQGDRVAFDPKKPLPDNGILKF
jgi:exopolysaccharide biosynthesis protein